MAQPNAHDFSNWKLPAPKMSNVELTMKEWNNSNMPINKLWDVSNSKNPAHREWYQNATSLPRSSRLIVWKTQNPFTPEHIFSRTIDTERLLPMNCAEFRMQFYADDYLWQRVEGVEGIEAADSFMTRTVTLMAHEIVLLRNRHDMGGGDIPVLLTNWTQEMVDSALDFWSAFSQDIWDAVETTSQYSRMHPNCDTNSRPCFIQADLLVRSLFGDSELGYLPPFLVIVPTLLDTQTPYNHARILFQQPCFAYPASLLQAWPTGCGAESCPETNCTLLDIKNTYALMDGSSMVRSERVTGVWGQEKGTLCNRWGCPKKKSPEKKLVQCARCKEVNYCGRECQKRDWKSHKLVCEQA